MEGGYVLQVNRSLEVITLNIDGTFAVLEL